MGDLVLSDLEVPDADVAERWNAAFSMTEWDEIFSAAAERGTSPLQLIRTAVLEDLYK